jgi:hypothetical protein
VDPSHPAVREFPVGAAVALGLLFVAGIGIVVFVVLTGRRRRS